MPEVMSQKLFLLCFVVTVGLVLPKLPGSSAGACGCPPLWTAFQGMCYRYLSAESVTWQEAERQCQSFTKPCWDEDATTGQLGHLVSIHSQEEMNFVITLFDSIQNKRFSGRHMVWIGLNDLKSEGSYEWSDGSEVNYTSWDATQPNNYNNQDCIEFDLAFNYMWHDLQCDPIPGDNGVIVGGFVCKLGQWL
ncbi:echinoidin-like [Diadema setosum]|uniref:echinoidin-like n=1 Tax=Diadema setosum TaxID=31175 RepID=UPI003B3A4986